MIITFFNTSMYVAVHVFYKFANTQTLATLISLLVWGCRPTRELFTHCNLTKARPLFTLSHRNMITYQNWSCSSERWMNFVFCILYIASWFWPIKYRISNAVQYLWRWWKKSFCCCVFVSPWVFGQLTSTG